MYIVRRNLLLYCVMERYYNLYQSSEEVNHYKCMLYSRLHYIGSNDHECNDDGKCPNTCT